ncbi:acetyl/propionyl/methylcrotonyl-CoA carboxylase subunit alpha [Vampirovibrio sp.]|uniref:acetyl-CoA carboxylase biotin carboxylase subunit n=1 Tax=Vampirovibrio sp. TaxID=2717857 RepID=UPI0035930CF2
MQKPLFKKILVANRGEIAVRVMKTIQEMGILAVALASDADLSAEHTRTADELIHLPGEKPADTYLQADLILEQAKALGVDAVHPGYGFLSENAAFAQSCAQAGIVFIGPEPGVIRDMGDKIIAKNLMQQAGVPVVPGWSGDLQTEFSIIQKEAAAIGYPLLVKAAAGGGGKGMRLVKEAEGLEAAFAAAAREAQSAFGDARVFLEKYITRPRHIEFQIFGDHEGNVVHLFERECSIQRRHQKIIEETPSPALNNDLRQRMGQAAVKAAKAMGYTNAGTVEFILAEDGAFYFLEVNTRLQVEHPVTEMTVHQDLVRLQIMVAAGLPLPFTQADLKQDGHAIECRIYAEDPARNFMPGIGKLAVYRPPQGPFIRLDGGVREGSEVTVHYDPMLAKLIVWGKNREAALQKMSWALSRFALLGVANNLAFLKAIIDHPQFQSGDIHTHFLEENPILTEETETPIEALLLGALSASTLSASTRNQSGTHSQTGSTANVVIKPSPWSLKGGWRQLTCQK